VKVDPQQGDDKSHVPAPSLLPVVFAIGVVVLLVGLIINNWIAVGIGAVIAIAFGGVWLRDVSTARGGEEAAEVPPPPSKPVGASISAATTATIAEGERYPRDRFLEGATLGLGAVIGAVVTIPPLALLTAAGFEGQPFHNINLGPITDFPEGRFMITTFRSDPKIGDVSRRTAYIRNNGLLDGQPSFTIISNHCAHLGCPVQPNGPVDESKKKTTTSKGGQIVSKTPTQPAGFGCPCHGGQYDTEGNRTAGPPVRALDRYAYSIVDGNLVLGDVFSVAKVKGTGKDAVIKKTRVQFPGQHVDGPEFWLWPIPEIRT
jgi:Rieske Fe-S protein